jgi:hypothetical protein
MMQPTSDAWAQDLAGSVSEAFKRMQKYSEMRKKFIAEHAGPYYGADSLPMGESRRPFNTLNMGVNVLVPNLAAQNPTIKVKPLNGQFAVPAKLLELDANYLCRRDNFAATVRRAVKDSIFTMGVAFTGLCDSGTEVPFEDGTHAIGTPYTDLISIDDYAVDPTSRHPDEDQFRCHRFRLRTEDIEKMNLPGEFMDALPDADESRRSDRSEDIDRTRNRHDADRFSRWKYLLHVYLPREGLVVWMPGPFQRESITGNSVVIRAYRGHDRGPYDELFYDMPPDCRMPVAPVGLWYDMHIALNTIGGKLVEQVKAIKNIIAGDLESETDLQTIGAAGNNDLVRVRNIDRIKQLTMGGPKEETLAIFSYMMEVSSRVQNNSDLVGGVRSGAGTATEAELLAANSNVRLSDMQGLVYSFVESVISKRMWYEMDDPLLSRTVSVEIQPDVFLDVPIKAEHISSEQMRTKFADFNFRVEAGSMQRMDPQTRVRRQLDHAQIIPMAIQVEQLSGGRFSADEFVRMTGRDLYEPGDLERIWRNPVDAQAQMMAAGASLNPAQGQSQGVSGMAGLSARPGMPGMPGRAQTGAGSINYDRSANTAAMQ